MAISIFHPLLTLSEDIAAASSRIGAYAYLWFSENTKDLAARSFKTKVEERLTALQNRLVFFDLWWQSVDEDNARRLMTGTARFGITSKPFAALSLTRCPNQKRRSSTSRTSQVVVPSIRSTTS